MMSTDQQTNEMSTEIANNEMSEEMYETEIQTLLGDNANYTAGQTDNETMEGANNGIIYVEDGVNEQTYMFDGDSLKVNLVSNNTYITDLVRTACQARINNLYTDLTFICQDGTVQAHSFLLDKLFFYCDIFFQLAEEEQLIFIPDCSKAQVESAVMEVYNCGTINRFCQLLNIHDGKDPAPVIYHNNPEDSSKYRISVRDIDELLDAKDKQIEAQAIKRKMELKTEKIEKNDQQTFNCTKCEHKARTRSLLRAHFIKHHKSTKSKSLLKVNNRTKVIETAKISHVTKDKPSSLLESGKDEIANTASTLENELVFSCLLCDFRTDSKFDLNQHKSHKHKKGERKKKHYCPHCDFSSSRVSVLKVHTVKEHKDIPKKFKCDRCDFATNYQTNMEKHMKKFHLGIPGPFQCTQCPRTFFVLAKLKCHKLVHTEEKNFVCEECAAKFKRKDDLKSHMKIHLPDDIRLIEKAKKLTKACPNCGKLFEKNWKLQRHMKVHNKESMVIERAQVPMRWEPIGGVVLTDSGGKTSAAIGPNAAGDTAIVEIQDGVLPPVQEFIVLTTDENRGGDGGSAAVGVAGPQHAAHNIIEDDDKYWV